MQLSFKILGEPKPKQSFRIGVINGRIMKDQKKRSQARRRKYPMAGNQTIAERI